MATKQPADKSHFILPDLGEGLDEAELIKWRVKPGEKVEEHQILAEMETDKALVEVPTPWAGVIGELRGSEGDTIKVGAILVTYQVGASAGKSAGAAAASTASKGSKSKAASQPKRAAAEESAAAEAEREDAGTVVGSVGGAMKISAALTRRRESESATAPAGKALATPAVRRIARDAGIDINRIPGTGRGGRVTASDVHDHAARSGSSAASGRSAATNGRAPSPAATDLPPVKVSGDGVAERIAFRGVRRKIADSLRRSVNTAVHFTCTDDADVTSLDTKRREYAKVLGIKLSFLPFVLLAVCRGLKQHPQLNANVDDEAGEILLKHPINLGIAVDTDHGLMVPVMHGAERLGLAELSSTVAALAEACRTRTIERERLMGGTFTISNVGSYGGIYATPIINYPEVGILALGRVREQVMVKNGAFYAGKSMPLSISCDHRVVDGAEGARFLRTIVQMLEQPDKLLG